MPRKSTYKKKRAYNRRRKRYYKNASPFRHAPVPTRMFTKLRYADYKNATPTVGGVDGVVISANGIYDPNISAGGHQPRGFDQLMLMYDHYVVVGAQISVRYVNTSSTVPLMAFLCLRDDTGLDSAVNQYLEDGRVISRPIGVTTGSNNITTLTFKCSTKKFLGRPSVLSDPELKGSASANPTEQAYFHFGCAATDQSSTGSVTIHYTVDYLVALIEPKQPAQS